MISSPQIQDRGILRDEIQQKAGLLWSRSVVRLRDRAVNQYLEPNIVEALEGFTLSVPGAHQKTYFTAASANVLTPLLEGTSTQSPAANKLFELHNTIVDVNESFYRGIIAPIDANHYERARVAKNLALVFKEGVAKIHKISLEVLNSMQESFKNLMEAAKPKVSAITDEHLPQEILRILDFMQGLILPNAVSQEEEQIAELLENQPSSETLKSYIQEDIPRLFEAWSKEIRAAIDTWWQQAEESYGVCIEHFKADGTD